MTKKFFCSLLILATLSSPALPRPKFDTKAFCKDLAKLWAKDLVAILAHELGHALAAKAFTNSPIDIHVGDPTSKIPTDHANLFRLGSPPVTLHTFLPISGWAMAHPNDSRFKNILTCLAGPLCGALAYYLFSLYEVYQEFKKHNIPWTTKKLFKRALFGSDIYIHLIESLFPLAHNDGAHILKEFYPKIDTDNRLYVPAAKVIIGLIIDAAVLTELQKKHRYDSLFFDKENIKTGNRFFFSMTHKLLAAIKCNQQKENFTITNDTTFDGSDVVSLLYMLLYKTYFASLKRVYKT